MSRKNRGEDRDITMRMIAAVKTCLAADLLSKEELALRLNISTQALRKRLNVGMGTNRYGSWPLDFSNKVARAFGRSIDHFIGLADNRTISTQYDIAIPTAETLLKHFEPYDPTMTGAIGIFRVPPGSIATPEFTNLVHRNYFSHLGELGGKLIAAHDGLVRAFRDEYNECGGHYNGFTMTTFMLESDVRQLLYGVGKTFANCDRHAHQWLDELRRLHVWKRDYRLGIIPDDRVLPEFLYLYSKFESVLLIDDKVVIFRDIGTLELSAVASGSIFVLCRNELRKLAALVNFDRTRISTQLERFQREADTNKKPRR